MFFCLFVFVSASITYVVRTKEPFMDNLSKHSCTCCLMCSHSYFLYWQMCIKYNLRLVLRFLKNFAPPGLGFWKVRQKPKGQKKDHSPSHMWEIESENILLILTRVASFVLVFKRHQIEPEVPPGRYSSMWCVPASSHLAFRLPKPVLASVCQGPFGCNRLSSVRELLRTPQSLCRFIALFMCTSTSAGKWCSTERMIHALQEPGVRKNVHNHTEPQ